MAKIKRKFPVRQFFFNLGLAATLTLISAALSSLARAGDPAQDTSLVDGEKISATIELSLIDALENKSKEPTWKEFVQPHHDIYNSKPISGDTFKALAKATQDWTYLHQLAAKKDTAGLERRRDYLNAALAMLLDPQRQLKPVQWTRPDGRVYFASAAPVVIPKKIVVRAKGPSKSALQAPAMPAARPIDSPAPFAIPGSTDSAEG